MKCCGFADFGWTTVSSECSITQQTWGFYTLIISPCTPSPASGMEKLGQLKGGESRWTGLRHRSSHPTPDGMFPTHAKFTTPPAPMTFTHATERCTKAHTVELLTLHSRRHKLPISGGSKRTAWSTTTARKTPPRPQSVQGTGLDLFAVTAEKNWKHLAH